jgi:4-amino-4-deoxy-L-arabinose transferase-like glycosyltransferase
VAGIVLFDLLLVLAGWYALANEDSVLRDWLACLVVWGATGACFCLIVGVLGAWSELKAAFEKVPRLHRFCLVILIVLAGFLVTLLPLRINRIYFDEHIYQNIAQSIYWLGRADLVYEGEAESGRYRVLRKDYNKQPVAFPFLVSLSYYLTGVQETSAHYVNNCLFVLSVFLAYALGSLWFSSSRAGIWGAFSFLLMPVVLQWCNTAASGPTAMCLAALGLLTVTFYFEKPSFSTAILAAGGLGFAVYGRPESMLLLIIAAALFLRRWKSFIGRHDFYLFVILFLLVSLPEFIHLYSVQDNSWGNEQGPKFGLDIFRNNLAVNGLFYIKNQRFPVLLTAFAFLSLLRRAVVFQRMICLLWFVLTWGIFLFFYAGSYDYGMDVRFSLVSAMPLALLAGCGIDGLLSRRYLECRRIFSQILIAVILIISWLQFIPLIREFGPKAWQARADVEFAREVAKELPDNSIIIAHNPNMFLLWGRNAVSFGIVGGESYVREKLFPRYPGGVFLHWNYWCVMGHDPERNFARRLLDSYPSVEFRRFDHPERDLTYIVYKLSPSS